MKKFEIVNDGFSRDEWTGSADEIINGIISCNSSWGTDYSKDDFYVSAHGRIYCCNELIAVEVTGTEEEER